MSASVALCLNVIGVRITGAESGARIDVAELLKNPVLRKLSVVWRPTSAPASSVWPMPPVHAVYRRSVWLNRFNRFVSLLYADSDTCDWSAVTAPGT